MSIFKKREVYKPFEYPKAFEYYQKQRQAHWSSDEIPMSADIQDWKFKLTESERRVVGQILKSFIQAEMHVEDYWAQKVSKWFPKPEIVMMASTFASFESIHIEAYAHLNDSLGIDDYGAFLQDPTAIAKLDRLKSVDSSNHSQIAKSLAIFSGFTEGVHLYSSFALLINFSRYNLLNGLGNIIEYSIRDESLHSEAGCWLFNIMMDERPELFTDELKSDIYEAARVTVQLEDDFIDSAFSLGQIRGLSSKQLKTFVRHRANIKLYDLGLKSNWKNLDKDILKEMEWFDLMTAGQISSDFFARKETQYAKVDFNVDNLFDC